MRLWHKDLIHFLPRQQLLGQWRECSLIVKKIGEKGEPGHLLVNKIMDYPLNHFLYYALEVRTEMLHRGYKCNDKTWTGIIDTICQFELYCPYVTSEEMFMAWHNERYLKQCLYNLQEKYDCGGITDKDWQRIKERWPEMED